jgi:hypothetical protein
LSASGSAKVKAKVKAKVWEPGMATALDSARVSDSLLEWAQVSASVLMKASASDLAKASVKAWEMVTETELARGLVKA